METQPLSKLESLTATQKDALKRANFLTVTDLLLTPSSEISKRCRMFPMEAQALLDLVCNELASHPVPLNDPSIPIDHIFTTGDSILDKALGGGIRTSKLWEITGESAAGKTQLSLQLALCVQLPEALGGASGSACFLSTSWVLPTNRLLQMVDAHPSLSPSLCGLSDIHTMKTTTIPALVHVLSKTLPDFLRDLDSSPNAKPVRLLVIDALTELFHSDDKVSSATMIERSRNLIEISNLLHSIANKHRIAVLVLNEVVDVFHRDSALGALDHEVGYREQARLFNRADSIPGEGQKEAALGLVWANQINARIMLSRTKRMRYLETESRATKRRRLSGGASADSISTSHLEDQPTRIRRLTVIFNSVAPPASLDYIVTECGVAVLDDQEQDLSVDYRPQSPMKDSTATILPVLFPVEGIAPLDIPTHDSDLSTDSLRLDQLPNSEGLLQSDGEPAATVDDGRDAEDGPQGDLTDDEFEAYWRDMDFGSDFFSQLDEGVSLSGIDPGRASDPGGTSSTNAA